MNQVERMPTKERRMLLAGGALAILGGMFIQLLFRALDLSQVEAWAGLVVVSIILVVIYSLAFREDSAPK